MQTQSRPSENAGHDLKRASTNAEAAAETAAEAAGTVREKLRQGYRQASARADEASQAVRGAATESFERGREAFDSARAASGTLTESLRDTIERQPLMAVGAAALVGYILGVLNRRR